MTHGAVVIGGGITTLNAVRCLGSNGIPVAVLQVLNRDIAHYSRWACQHLRLHNFLSQPESILELLEHQVRKWRDWVLLPTGDPALSVLSQHRDYLARYYRVAVPSWDVTRTLLEKNLTYQAAEKAGIDIPRCYGDAVRSNIQSRDISFPVVVKPLISHQFTKHFSKKLFPAENRTELLRCVDVLAGVDVRAKIFDLVPGPDDLFYNYSVYMDQGGEPVAELGMKKIRKDPPFFGVCRVGERADIPQLREPTIEILRRIGWRGMANAEYKLDPRDGRFRLMEINGRCFLMHGLARRAGVNYPLLAWREYGLGEKGIGAQPNDWRGVWIHLLGDLYYCTFHRADEGLTLRNYAAAYKGPRTFAVWSAEDPRPFVMEWAYTMKRSAARIGKGMKFKSWKI